MHLTINRRRLIAVAGISVVALTACVATSTTRRTAESAEQTTVSSILGTWAGTSTCVGNRPACKNESVVYRFLAVDGQPHQVRLLGDKIVDGKRLPMGGIVFDVDEQTGTLRGEFQRGQTHAVWSFTLDGDEIKGTLVVMPEGAIGREVSVHRAREEDLPTPPAVTDYDE